MIHQCAIFAHIIFICALLTTLCQSKKADFSYVRVDGAEFPDDFNPFAVGRPGNLWRHAAVSNFDDALYDYTLEPILINFAFPWYGRIVETAYLSPNGGIHFNHEPPCCKDPPCHFTGHTPRCDFNTSYDNMIAASVVDMDPTMGGDIFYRSSPTHLDILYFQIPLFFAPWWDGAGRDERFSFMVTLDNLGRVIFRYYEVTDPTNIEGTAATPLEKHSPRDWLVGLRPPFSYGSNDTLNQDQWKTSVNGTYIPKNWVQAESTIYFWPMTSMACASPLSGPTTGKQLVRIAISGFQSNQLGYSFSCRFYKTEVFAFYNSTSGLLGCYSPSLSLGKNVNKQTVPLTIMDTDIGVALPIKLSYTYTQDDSGGKGKPRTESDKEFCQTCGYLEGSPCDCAGQFLGTAEPDDCGVCSGGNTGVNPRRLQGLTPATVESRGMPYMEDFCRDCPLVWDGFCARDCAGSFRGDARLDTCGVCSGGSTGLTKDADVDCAGVCFGNFKINQLGQCACEESSSIGCGPSAPTPDNTSDTLGAEYQYSVYSTNGTVESDPVPSFKTSPPWCQEVVLERYGSGPLAVVPVPAMRLGNEIYSYAVISRTVGTVYLTSWNPSASTSCPLIKSEQEKPVESNSTSAVGKPCGPVIVLNASVTSYVGSPADPVSSSTSPHDGGLDLGASLMLCTWFDEGLARIKFRGLLPTLYVDRLLDPSLALEDLLPVTHAFDIVLQPRPNQSDLVRFEYMQIPPPPSGSWIGGKGGTLESLPDVTSAGTPTIYIAPVMLSDADEPIPSAVRSGDSLTVCLVGMEFCASPSQGKFSGGEIVRIFAKSLDCLASQEDLKCSFGGIRVPAIYNATLDCLLCTAPPGIVGTDVMLRVVAAGKTLPSDREKIVLYRYTDTAAESVSHRDICAACGHIADQYCRPDCSGVWKGEATVDDCGDCSGGTTGRSPNESKDCMGICYGTHKVWPENGQCYCTVSDSIGGHDCGIQPAPPPLGEGVQYLATSSTVMDAPLLPESDGQEPFERLAFNESFYKPVHLPFSFSFFGAYFRKVYLASSGFVVLNVSRACADVAVESVLKASGDGNDHTSSGCVWSVLAPCFDGALAKRDVYYRVSKERLAVVSVNTLAPSDRFSMVIHRSGNMVWRHNDSSCSVEPSKRSFAGIRRLHTAVTLPPSLRGDRASVTLCSMATDIRIVPNRGMFAGGTRVNVYPGAMSREGRGKGMGCGEAGVNFSCSFGGVVVPATYDSALELFQCLAPPGLARTSVVLELLPPSGMAFARKLSATFTYVAPPPSQLPRPKEASLQSALSEVCVNLDSDDWSVFGCKVDCNGQVDGTAFVDDCGVCSGGSTGKEPNQDMDCSGMCFGPFVAENVTSLSTGSTSEECGCFNNLYFRRPSLYTDVVNRFICSKSNVLPGRTSYHHGIVEHRWEYRLVVLCVAIFCFLLVPLSHFGKVVRMLRDCVADDHPSPANEGANEGRERVLVEPPAQNGADAVPAGEGADDGEQVGSEPQEQGDRGGEAVTVSV